MNKEITIEDALKEAVNREETSYEFYKQLHSYVNDLGTKALVNELAEEEKSHIEILHSILNNKKIDEIKLGAKCYIIDLGLTRQVRPEVITEDMPVEAVLRIAIRYAENARKFYDNLADKLRGENVENLFRQLAHEEMCHRNNFQLLYDELVFKEN
jgi:rubrerythrin